MDAKATVQIGELCRGGMSWVVVKALDRDFKPDAIVTPIDILLPSSMTWKDEHPTVVVRFHKTYDKGAKLTRQAMQAVEDRIERLLGLEKRFVQLAPLVQLCSPKPSSEQVSRYSDGNWWNATDPHTGMCMRGVHSR